MIAFLEANALYSLKPSITDCSAKAYVFVGEKEINAMKKSAKIIHKNMHGSVLKIFCKMHHGEFSINHADDYVNTLHSIIGGKICLKQKD